MGDSIFHRISSLDFFIGLRGVIGTFLLNGLRTEFKRISTFGRWHSGDNGCEEGLRKGVRMRCEDEVCYLCYTNLNIIGMELLYKELTDKILAAAYQVHRELGCGFLEKVYQEALAVVLSEMGYLLNERNHWISCIMGKRWPVNMWQTS